MNIILTKMFFLYHFSIDANGMLTENMVNKAHGKLFYFPQITFFFDFHLSHLKLDINL